MARIRLLADTPEGAPGNEVIVSSQRAVDLVKIGQAERVIDRSVPVEHTDAPPRRGKRP